MANKLNIKLQEWLDNNEHFKGKFIGYKESRGGLGISRIDNDWHECDDYLIRFEDLLEALADKHSSVPQANELLPHVSKRSELFCVKNHEFDKCDRFKHHLNGCNFCDIQAK